MLALLHIIRESDPTRPDSTECSGSNVPYQPGYVVVTCEIKLFQNYKKWQYSDVLPLKAARQNSIFNLTSFRSGFKPFVKFCDNVGDPSYCPPSLPDCLCHVVFSRYSPLSLKIVEKTNKCKRFWLPF